MTLAIKQYLLLYYIGAINAGPGGVIVGHDRPYDVINIKVPQVVWSQALRPTPVLKSPVTIVVPVHIAQDDNDVEDDIEEDVVENENEVINATITNDEVVQEPVQEAVSSTPAVTSVTQRPVAQDQPADQPAAPPEQVTGQVTRFPCSCLRGQCGCCTGAILQRFRMNACGNISFVPEDFVFDVRLSVNNNTVIRRRVSASDPPPICFNPRRAPFVQVCAEISNIRIQNRNAFACLDINADIGGFPVYTASFRCFGLGTSGVQTGLKPKPVSSGPAPVNLFGNGGDDGDDDGGGFLDGVAGGILGGDEEGGLFGGGGDSDDDDGPFDGIGDAVGDFFDGRKI